jgi:hypothetical protein
MQELLKNWLADLNGKNQNTYKFALQLAILEFSRDQHITYTKIAHFFAHKYWDNVVAYNLRETTNIDQAPYFHTAIYHVAKSHKLEGLYFHQAKRKLPHLTELILKQLPNGYNRALQNPISRLQSNSTSVKTGSGSSTGEGWLFHWDSSKELITFNAHFKNLIQENSVLLKKLTVFHWALFIERYNQLPSVTSKLIDKNESRTIKKKIRDLVIEHAQGQCFYCEEFTEVFDIDHFIPFAFIFDHPLWNLVYSCQECNRGKEGKFEKLPRRHFLNKLLLNNRELVNNSALAKEYFQKNNILNEHIQKTYQNCINAGFKTWEPKRVKK